MLLVVFVWTSNLVCSHGQWQNPNGKNLIWFFFLYAQINLFCQNLWYLCLIACRCCWSYPGVNLSDDHLAEQKASVSWRLSCWALNQWITQSMSQKEQRNPSNGLNRRLIFHSHHLFNRTQIHTFVMNSITRRFSLLCAEFTIWKGSASLFTFDLRARDRCVDLDVKLDPDWTVTRCFFFSSSFPALNFLLLFFYADTNTSVRWYNWLCRQSTDVSCFQLLESFQTPYFCHLQGSRTVCSTRFPRGDLGKAAVPACQWIFSLILLEILIHLQKTK